MIIVHGTFPIRPDAREEALAAMREMTVASVAEEGCISYEFYTSLNDPNTLLLFQEWQDLDALQDHFQTGHMEDFLQKLPDLLAGEVSTRRYLVQSSDDAHEEEIELPVSFDRPDTTRIVH